MKNQRVRITSKIVLIPAGLVLIAGVFVLGFYAGQHRGKSPAPGQETVPLPSVKEKSPTQQEDFTFYKTLTDKEDKTVSIDLKPKVPLENQTDKKASAAGEKTTEQAKQREAGPDKAKAEPEPSAGMKQHAPVKELPKVREPNSKHRYTLQVASYPEKNLANANVRKMKQRGYSAFIVKSELKGKGTWFRVRVGSFSSKAGAEKLQKELSRKGVKTILAKE